jgi:hypothetical protein
MACAICLHDLTRSEPEKYTVAYSCDNCKLFKEEIVNGWDTYCILNEKRINLDDNGYDKCVIIIKELKAIYDKENSIPNGFHEVCKIDEDSIRYAVIVEDHLDGLQNYITVPDIIEPRQVWDKDDFSSYNSQLIYALHTPSDLPKTEEIKLQRWVDLCIKYGMTLKQ